jgi:hypothetical protein
VAKVPEKSRRKLLVYYTILWLFLAILGLASVLRSTLIVYPAFACLFLAMGILAGVAFGYFSERRHLKIIEKEGACNIALPSLAAWAVILILIVAAFILVFSFVVPIVTN